MFVKNHGLNRSASTSSYVQKRGPPGAGHLSISRATTEIFSNFDTSGGRQVSTNLENQSIRDPRAKRPRDPYNASAGRVSQYVELGKNRPIVDLGAIEEEEHPGMGESILKPAGYITPSNKREEESEKSDTTKGMSGLASHEGVVKNLDNLI